MGIPKMPAEYELPNLCGANAGLGDVQKKIDEGIKNLTDRIEFSASDIKAKMETDFAERNIRQGKAFGGQHIWRQRHLARKIFCCSEKAHIMFIQLQGKGSILF